MSQPTTLDYQVEIYSIDKQFAFGRRSVDDHHLESGRVQVNFEALRNGLQPSGNQRLAVSEEVEFADSQTGEIHGVTFSVESGADRYERSFGTDLFAPFAQRVTSELIVSKQLEPTEKVKYRVYAIPAAAAEENDSIVATLREESLPLLSGNLDSLLEIAHPVNSNAEDDYPVFVVESALEQAQQISWKRNEERGAWLVGNLYTQSSPKHELFAVIHSVFEARGAKHARFSLDFNTATWQHASEQLARRQSLLGHAHDLLLGFYHTHPFLPSILDGEEACHSCSLRDQCQLTSSFFSQRDGQFHSAVFGRAGYAVEMVLGLDPREQFVLKMFTLDGGRFRERGFHTLSDLPAEFGG